MLSDELLPVVRNMTLMERILMWFQQDGAPPHFDRRVRAFLDTYLHNQWIGRQGPVPWPPRSADLTPLDFYLWGYLKSVVYDPQPSTIAQLKVNIRMAIAGITAETLEKVMANCLKRMTLCKQQNGEHFEHLL